jgi:hypothetical protein
MGRATARRKVAKFNTASRILQKATWLGEGGLATAWFRGRKSPPRFSQRGDAAGSPSRPVYPR